MPVKSKLPTEASFVIGTDSDGDQTEAIIRPMPNSRRSKFQVVWSCGDTVTIDRAEIQRIVDLFSRKSKYGLYTVLHTLYKHPYEQDWKSQNSYFLRVDDDGYAHVFETVYDETASFNWVSFIEAWKSLNN